jgi:hypothetical protein
MKSSTEIHIVSAGKRTYFIDLKKEENEPGYLLLTESKRVNTNFERHSILIEKEKIEELAIKLLDALSFFEDDSSSTEVVPKSHMAKLKRKV